MDIFRALGAGRRSSFLLAVVSVGLLPCIASAQPGRAASTPPPPSASSAPDSRDPWAEPDYTKNWDSEPAPTPQGELVRLRGAALKVEVPDLEVRQGLPPVRFAAVLGAHFPFQIVGVGLEVEGYVPSWLRWNVFYSAGLSSSGTDFFFSNYVDTSIGFRLLGVTSERDVDITEDEVAAHEGKSPPRPSSVVPHVARGPSGPGAPIPVVRKPPPRVVFKAALPTTQAVYVEAGMLSGALRFQACLEECLSEAELDAEAEPDPDDMEPETRQLVMLFGGFRYVYFVDARSQRKPLVTRRFHLQAFAHAIAKPYNDWEAAEFWGDGSEVRRNALGGRVGVRMPTCLSGRCAALHFVLGYLPTPGSIFVHAGITH